MKLNWEDNIWTAGTDVMRISVNCVVMKDAGSLWKWNNKLSYTRNSNKTEFTSVSISFNVLKKCIIQFRLMSKNNE